MIIQVMIKYPHQLMIRLHLFEWLSCFSCLSTRELFRMKIVYAFMFDGPKRAGTKLIRLANRIGCVRVVRFERRRNDDNRTLLH